MSGWTDLGPKVLQSTASAAGPASDAVVHHFLVNLSPESTDQSVLLLTVALHPALAGGVTEASCQEFAAQANFLHVGIRVIGGLSFCHSLLSNGGADQYVAPASSGRSAIGILGTPKGDPLVDQYLGGIRFR